MARTSADLMEFDADSPRAPVAAVSSSSSSSSGDGASYFSDLRVSEPLPSLPLTSAAAAAEGGEPERLSLCFFVSCAGVDGALAATPSSARTAQTLVRGALSMLTQSGKPKTVDVNVEVRVSRELPTHRAHPGEDAADVVTGDDATSDAGGQTLGSESYWSERRRGGRSAHFAVGFRVRCRAPLAAFDRHVQVLVMVPDEGQSGNKNSQLFGVAQTTFQEMYAVAASGRCQQPLTLPVRSPLCDGASVTLRFVDVAPQPHPLFAAYSPSFRSFLFAPPDRDGHTPGVAAKLAVEEAAEVDFSVKIPLQLMSVCHLELSHMYADWKARYNYNRKRSRHFEDDLEALNFGHDVYRVQVVCARNLTANSGSSSGDVDGASGAGSGRPSTFSIAGRGGIMNRLKTQAGKWGGPSGGSATTGSAGGDLAGGKSEGLNPFVVVKYSDGTSGPHEYVVGKTNTEYDTGNPVWSTNKHAAKCAHGKPNTKLYVSAALPSRVEVSRVNTLKQFLFYRPSALQNERCGELSGWLRFEVFNESYAYMTGVENELIGEVLLPLQSVRDAMAVEQQEISDGGSELLSPRGSRRQTVTSLTLVDWFDVRSPTTDEIFGQIQLRLNIILANPVAPLEDATHAADGPRTQRLAADCAPPPASNPLENEMPLEFLYPHVLNLQRHIAEVTAMIRLSESLLAQKKTFKSSQDKKRADVQSIPTNLHVSYFRIYRNFASQLMPPPSLQASSAAAAAAPLNHQTSTEDLLGLGYSNAHAPPTESHSSTLEGLSLEQRALLPETHATITCGAPTAHAMGLSEYGLREMELEIHRLQGILDKCSPRLMTSSVSDNAFVAEDAANELVFSSIGDEPDDTGEDDELVTAEAEPLSSLDDAQSPSDRESMTKNVPKKAAPNMYSTMAARAVAGAKAAKKRLPATKKTSKLKDQPSLNDDDANANRANEIKYPTLRTEAEDGIDPSTSINYAVRVLCRLEMLRTEYYLRKSVAVSQSVSGLVACFVAELDLCLQEQNVAVLEQLASVGFLIGWESLISSHGKELRMLSDAWVAIKCLETFAFQLVESSDGTRDVVLAKREHVGYTIRVPVPPAQFALLPASLRDGALIAVTSVLFTQGINEMQSLANMVGHSGVSIQSKINSASFRSVVAYYNRFTASGAGAAASVGAHPDEILRNLRASVERESASAKNTCILLHASDAVRSLHGGRVTYCKSGKDRTAMSVTLEQARLLVQRKRHVLEEIETGGGGAAEAGGPLDEVKRVANTLREFGVRIEIARKNVGRCKYSFNSIQRKLLPEIYRPPVTTIQDIVTSVTARDS